MPAPTVISINTSAGGIPKRPLPAVEVGPGGLAGDDHDHEKHRTPLQAVSIIDVEDLEDLRREGYEVGPGATGENLTVRGLDVDSLAIGDRLTLSGGVELELTKRRRPCYVLDSIDPTLKKALVDRCGFYALVVSPGLVEIGERVDVVRGAPANG